MLEILARPLRSTLVDFGIDSIFKQFDKRLGRNVSNLLLICVAILIFVMTIRVILETILGAGLVLERLEALSSSEDMREIVLYIVGQFAILLILLAGFVLFVKVLKRRFIKNLSVDLDNYKRMGRELNEQLCNKAEELERREQDISAREEKLNRREEQGID